MLKIRPFSSVASVSRAAGSTIDENVKTSRSLDQLLLFEAGVAPRKYNKRTGYYNAFQ
jgi:hypothetical protein